MNTHKYPTSFQTVDNAVIRDNGVNRSLLLLLGRKKKDNGLWRFPGGFVDPKDLSLEYAALRELNEECGNDLRVVLSRYLFSCRIDDPRYQNSEDKIMTAVFLHQYRSGGIEACDDLDDVAWFNIDNLLCDFEKTLVPMHRIIFRNLIYYGQVRQLHPLGR